ncbi:MAG TPA: ATP-binding protein [Polyangiaceae bacterium]|nr:ATP-binding protein [Polyangiaceae bacterium]
MSEPPSAPAVVWVVDDSRLQADVCRDALADRYGVRVFEGGAAMLEALALGDPPQLLVLDWHMPDMSGGDVCRFVRETFDAARLPILILTATGTNESLLEGLAAGANDFVRKPFLISELNARAAALVRSAALHSKLLAVERQLRVEADFRERFMGMLAHDLRQPLNAIFMSNSALSATLAGSPLAATTQLQSRAAARMKRMIAELLDFTRVRPESGLPIQRAATDFSTIIKSVVAEVRAAHAERAVELEVQGDCVGDWDADRLAQLCSNLLSNAIEHGDTAAPVRLRLDGRASDSVELLVSNTGKPIPSEALPQLFLAFRRAPGQGRGRGGVGLGLYIVDQIVRGHGGSIEAHSDETATRFTVRLPRASA